MFNILKKFSPTQEPLKLTPNEVEYKNNTLSQFNKLLEGVLRNNTDTWNKLQTKLSAEIDEQILIARRLGKTPQQVEQDSVNAINAELERKHTILRNGYSLSIEDYQKIIAPLFEMIDFFPEPNTVTFSGNRAGELLYFVSNNDYYTSKDAQDKLMGFCDSYAVARVAKAVRTTYEIVRRCEDAGILKVRLVADRKCCKKCQSLDGTEISAKAILDDFNAGTVSFPHSLPSDDTVNYCLGPYLLPLEI